MSPPNDFQWRIYVDRGGTFTDVVAYDPGGQLHVRKVLSAVPGSEQDPALRAVRELLGVDESEPLPAGQIGVLHIGTTVATNALLERKGAPTALVITRGFGDQLEIGNQARPDIFAARIAKTEPLYSCVVEADERVLADGRILRPLDLAALERDLKIARDRGITSVAIVFVHAYAFPAHEQAAASLARQLGFEQVCASHDVAPLVKIVGRGDTTVADAYLTPVLRTYLARVDATLATAVDASAPAPQIRFMASSGGLKSKSSFRGRDAILSGPAGGVVGMAETAKHAGFQRVIGFDMGGTSTDVSHFAGDYERAFETEVAGVRLRVPMLDIHTVAAGGGSIVQLANGRLMVGPKSAGSDPGPACYRRGGPLTLTDANVMVGKLAPEAMPQIFGPAGNEPPDAECVRELFSSLAREMGFAHSAESIAEGAIRVGVENMAAAIRKISIERGHDIADYALQSFGSASGQHACLIAEALGMRTILVHPLSGLLSAFGIGLAALRASREVSIERLFSSETLRELEEAIFVLGNEVTEALLSEGVAYEHIALTTRVHLAYADSDTTLAVDYAEPELMRRDFESLHKRRFGFIAPETTLRLSTIEVEARGGRESLGAVTAARDARLEALHGTSRQIYTQGAWQTARILARSMMAAGSAVEGPAIVLEPHQTVVVEPGWIAELRHDGNLVMRHETKSARRSAPMTDDDADPVSLEVFANRFMSIAQDMGEALRQTARSVNIKERLDFSCAIFDGAGELVANAPHVPVHLGSMDRAVIAIVERFGGAMRPGDAFMLNAPYTGGTHLPDITVVTPVFVDEEAARRGAPSFFVASRGHHADIGGISPGSMSPRARTIDEEGVVIEPMPILKSGSFLERDVRAVLTGAPYPARNPATNIADLKAQLAANARGVLELERLCAQYGSAVVARYMSLVQSNSEATIRAVIRTLRGGHFRVETDQGFVIVVTVDIDCETGSAVVDFSGTSPIQFSSFNAPEPVVRAAVLYVFRVLAGTSMPINAGCLKPIEIRIPEGSMLAPRHPAPVVAGNTETSQIITNALFAALGAMASSQGTMNNLTFGNGSLQYYETICSGSPAGPGFNGTPAVQVHMTNTRMTDPEILELRYPVMVEEFSIRRGSGGHGRWRSGDGTRRILRFLEPMHVAILSGYRRVAPFGLDGGAPGACGRNAILKRDGDVVCLDGCAAVDVEAGDAILIETPTGGGFGTPQ